MSLRQVRLVWIAALLVLMAAAVLRLTHLGWAPLSDGEALAALAATAGTPAQSPFWASEAVGAAPAAYQSLTGPLFTIFGGSDRLARVIPALAGVGLVALPLLFVRRFGWPVAIAAAAALTISSSAMYVSRTAGGTALAVLGVGVFWLGAVHGSSSNRWLAAAGFGLGLALSSGHAVWMGLFGLLIGFLAWRVGGNSSGGAELEKLLSGTTRRETLAVAVLTLVLLSTRFGFQPAAFADAIASPGLWLSGWVQGSGFSLASSFWMLIVYEPLLLVGGVIGAVAAFRSPLPERSGLVYWSIGALLAFLFYPGRSPEQLIWVILPASFLFGFGLEAFLDGYQRIRAWQAPAALVGLLLVLGAFTYALLQQVGSGVGVLQLTGSEQAVFGVAALAFIGALIALFGMGWSWHDTSVALTAFAGISLALLTLSAGFELTHDPEASPDGIWRRRAASVNVRLLSETLEALSSAHIGRTEGMQIVVMGQADPSLAWEIREYEPWANAADQSGPPPPVILAPDGRDPQLPADYLGQAFAVYERSAWSGSLPPSPLAWWLDQRAPTDHQSWVLYVRTDVAGLDDGDSFPTVNGN